MDADVIIVGAGATGLMLASELRLAGVEALVLERQPRLREAPKANAIFGQILELLRYRGLRDRVEAAGVASVHRPPQLPFGNLYIDLTQLPVPLPVWGLRIPQPRLEAVLDCHARELGAEIRRGHTVTSVDQDDTTATVEASSADGARRFSARYVVGADGAWSRVRESAQVAFPGTTLPEVNRLAQSTLHPSVTRLENGDLDVPGLGILHPGFTRTDRGVFAFGQFASDPRTLGLQTTEEEGTPVDDDAPLTITELQASIRRVLGGDFPLGEVTRLSRYGFQARLADPYRAGRIFLAGDAAHQFPATGIGINVGMLDAVNLGWKLAAAVHGWAPDGLLDSYHTERYFAGERAMMQTRAQAALRRDDDPSIVALRELLQELITYEQPLAHMGQLIAGTDIRYPLANPNGHAMTGSFMPDLAVETGAGATSIAALMAAGRPVLLDLADRPDLREAAQPWGGRVDLHTATSAERPADALLIRPDAHIAWAAALDEAAGDAVPGLREALTRWFGTP